MLCSWCSASRRRLGSSQQMSFHLDSLFVQVMLCSWLKFLVTVLGTAQHFLFLLDLPFVQVMLVSCSVSPQCRVQGAAGFAFALASSKRTRDLFADVPRAGYQSQGPLARFNFKCVFGSMARKSQQHCHRRLYIGANTRFNGDTPYLHPSCW